MGYYSPGNHVHWIQARKAFEDAASWRAAWVFEIGTDRLTVGFDERDRFSLACLSGCIPVRLRERLALTDRLPVEVSLRWSLLRYGKALVSVRGPLPPAAPPSGEPTPPSASKWRVFEQWRATATTGCDSPLRPCHCRPDPRTRRPPGPINP